MVTVKLEKVLKAASDRTRVKVLMMLDGKESIRVKEIKKRLKHVESTLLSHHLSILKKAGMVRSVRKGKEVEYTKIKEPVDLRLIGRIFG